MGPIKRLWHYLVRQESVQKIFVKYIFGRKTKPSQQNLASTLGQTSEPSDFASYDDHYMLQQMARIYHPVKIIHKEHDAITAFCINKVIKTLPLSFNNIQYIGLVNAEQSSKMQIPINRSQFIPCLIVRSDEKKHV